MTGISAASTGGHSSTVQLPVRTSMTQAEDAKESTTYSLCDIDREFVTSAKKFANFNEFSEIKKFVKIRKNSLNAVFWTRVPGYPGNKLPV